MNYTMLVYVVLDKQYSYSIIKNFPLRLRYAMDRTTLAKYYVDLSLCIC